MRVLTPELLDHFPYSQYADPRTIQRGRAYFEEDRVWDVTLSQNDSRATCLVHGDGDEYNVEIEVDQRTGQLYFDCDCPFAENNFCKHMVAAALELSGFLKGEDNDFDEEDDQDVLLPFPAQRSQPSISWQTKLDQTLANLPRAPSTAGANIQRYVAVLLITKEEYFSFGSFNFIPFVIKTRDWNALQGVSPGDTQTINDLLDKNHEWIKYGEEMYSQINPAGCLNLPPETVTFLNFLQQYMRFFSGANTIANYLPMIAQLQIPVFIASRYQKTVKSRVQILPNPLDVQVVFTREQGNLILRAGLQADTFTPTEGKAEVISYSPAWLLMGDKVFTLKNRRQSIHPCLLPHCDPGDASRFLPREISAPHCRVPSDQERTHPLAATSLPRRCLVCTCTMTSGAVLRTSAVAPAVPWARTTPCAPTCASAMVSMNSSPRNPRRVMQSKRSLIPGT